MSQARRQMGVIESTLSKGVAAYQRRHGGELPRGACLHEKVDNHDPAKALEEKEKAMGLREPSTLPLFAELGAEHLTPFDELAEQERRMDAESKEAALISLEAHFWLLDFLFADGPHPGKVMRRLYAWVKKYRPELVWDMGYRNLGELFGESGAAMEWRVGQMIDNYAEAHGMRSVKMPWQRTAEACAAYSEVQQENSNRSGGQRSAKHKDKARKSSRRNPKTP